MDIILGKSNVTSLTFFPHLKNSKGVMWKMANQQANSDMQNSIHDNAGGGARGFRARPSDELFQAVHDSYGINHLEDSIDLGGSSALNLYVKDGQNPYVVRVYRPYLTEARFADYRLVRQKFHANHIPVSEVVPTLDGQEYMVFDGRFVEVERYVEHDAYMDSWELLMKGLPLLGRIHTILKEVQCSTDGKNPPFANYIEPEKALEKTLQGTQRIRSWNSPTDIMRLSDAAEELAFLVSKHEHDLITRLPRQMVHGDYWHNNVFFRNDRIVLINDFDFMGERTRIDDLALILYFFSCSDKPVTGDLLGRLRSLVDAYDAGLDEHLSTTERLAIPLAMARQPLWSIGGWILSLDDERAAKRHATGMPLDIDWALRIMYDLDRWQAAFVDAQ